MTNNLFEIALAKNETKKFFLGEDNYFLLNREDGTHSYVMQTASVGRDYIESELNHDAIFVDRVSEFLQEYSDDKSEMAAVWQTVLAIAKLTNSDIISLNFIDKHKNGSLKKVLQKLVAVGQSSELGKGYLQILKSRSPVLYQYITDK